MSNFLETKEYNIVRLNEKNLSDVEALHIAVYKKNPPQDHFTKKYNSAYTGKSFVGYIAYNNENIAVAYYGVIPCFIEYDNKIILAAQSADTMTHPGYRYKGMFVELSNLCFELCRSNNINLIFGFPNQNSYHGAVNKLGWKMTEIMNCFEIPIRSSKLIRSLKKFILTKKIYESFVRSVLKNHMLVNENGLANSVIKDGFAGVHRSKEYLAYKTYSKTYVLKIGSSKMWIKIDNNLTIGDIELNEQNFDDIINTAKKISKKLGLNCIYFHACRNTTLHKYFEERYKSIPSFHALFQDFGSAIAPEKIKFTFADIDIF